MEPPVQVTWITTKPNKNDPNEMYIEVISKWKIADVVIDFMGNPQFSCEGNMLYLFDLLRGTKGVSSYDDESVVEKFDINNNSKNKHIHQKKRYIRFVWTLDST